MISNADALNSPMTFGDFPELTIGQYLKKLLVTLVQKGEGFSGKRPFGNSGWELDLEYALVLCGYVPGQIFYYDTEDENNDPDVETVDYDRKLAEAKIIELIEFVFIHY